MPGWNQSETSARVVGGARQTALLAGRGAVDSDAGKALGELGEAIGAPLFTTLLANGLFTEHRLNAGVCGGLGDGRALRAVEHCDLVIAVGAELNQWTTHFGQALDGRRLVQIDTDPAAFGRYCRPDVALLGDATATVRALTDRIRAQQQSSREPSAELKSILEHPEPLDSSPYLDTDSSVDPRHALADIDRLLPPDRRVVIDGGHAAQSPSRPCEPQGPATGPAPNTATSPPSARACRWLSAPASLIPASASPSSPATAR